MSDIKNVTFDEVLVDCLVAFWDEALKRNIRLFICMSPRYKKGTYLMPEKARQFVDEHNIPIIDFNIDSNKEFLDTTLFRDANHLNNIGARVFSKRLAVILREKFGLNVHDDK